MKWYEVCGRWMGKNMEVKIILEFFECILSGYCKVEELVVNVIDCLKLV